MNAISPLIMIDVFTFHPRWNDDERRFDIAVSFDTDFDTFPEKADRFNGDGEVIVDKDNIIFNVRYIHSNDEDRQKSFEKHINDACQHVYEYLVIPKSFQNCPQTDLYLALENWSRQTFDISFEEFKARTGKNDKLLQLINDSMNAPEETTREKLMNLHTLVNLFKINHGDTLAGRQMGTIGRKLAEIYNELYGTDLKKGD